MCSQLFMMATVVEACNQHIRMAATGSPVNNYLLGGKQQCSWTWPCLLADEPWSRCSKRGWQVIIISVHDKRQTETQFKEHEADTGSPPRLRSLVSCREVIAGEVHRLSGLLASALWSRLLCCSLGILQQCTLLLAALLSLILESDPWPCVGATVEAAALSLFLQQCVLHAQLGKPERHSPWTSAIRYATRTATAIRAAAVASAPNLPVGTDWSMGTAQACVTHSGASTRSLSRRTASWAVQPFGAET